MDPWQQPWPQSQNPFQAWAQGMQNPYGRISQFYQYPPSFPNQQVPQLPNQNPLLSLPFSQQQPSQQQQQQLMLPFQQQKSNQLPSQPVPNPNNKNPQNAYMVEGQ